ncbi:UDP-N-acetylmuramoyl-L-alanine--D-glutamate ligase [Kushneria marisflavi]|uniref:UDP-N-acetylmuramoylalanine--D-glutamate ligase n=1 Tax=Kushneria marisflavi TaxID=157779 RepID=A0A240UT12_9GAMM|nr:UDP-N-acetylmuramoyl-L-alanine--D-glutamate ligase [Kushneria marisflavi]ART64276.1 UDP-N-acetylmuramoyl-L-alanine--D-glutamate ligase [Kushneria marisflavi]RKD76739.1 UDP-N-acetylmuramoylalanine--D-glutamate ligase [Kushneria marisflavi]
MLIESHHSVVVGLGRSGLAIAEHLIRRGEPFVMADTRAQPAGLAEFQRLYPDVAVHCGDLSALALERAGRIILSPGVDVRTPGLPRSGPEVVGETALFVEALNERDQRPMLIAITGSNAKSTVTTLVGDMAHACGIDVAVGGNLGTPALTLLAQRPEAACFVLELSSFQLETTPQLNADVAVYLNLSSDHLDRHDGMAGYGRAKQQIFNGAGVAIINRDDPATMPCDAARVVRTRSFGSDHPISSHDWGLDSCGDEVWLMQGEQTVMAARDVMMPGQHNLLNVLAALAVGHESGWPRERLIETVTHFAGLPHRAQRVADINGVTWINDSKGTNVGATLAAIEGIGMTLSGRLVLLAGGVGKGADFAPLAEPLSRYARTVVVYGRDRAQLAHVLEASVTVVVVDTLEQAMQHAMGVAQPGDAVLLSPACASLDQFDNFEARGDLFCAWLKQWQPHS